MAAVLELILEERKGNSTQTVADPQTVATRELQML